MKQNEFRRIFDDFMKKIIESTPEDAETAFAISVLVTVQADLGEGLIGSLADVVAEYRQGFLESGIDSIHLASKLTPIALSAKESDDAEVLAAAGVLLVLLSVLEAGQTYSMMEYLAPFCEEFGNHLQAMLAAPNN